MSRTLETADDLEEGVRWLAARDPVLAEVRRDHGLPPLRRRPGGFAEMLRIISGQKLSTASGDAVWRRLIDLGAGDAEALSGLSDDALYDAGLSRAKIRYARALADARPDWEALAHMEPDDAIRTLTAIPGIGPWSAEVYLMISVGHADVFPAGDLALQVAAGRLYGIDPRPGDKALRQLAEQWSPWRAVAARLLWAYYLGETGRPGTA